MVGLSNDVSTAEVSGDPWNTVERRALRSLVHDFTVREIVPHLEEWEEQGELPRELHRKAAEAGLLGVGIPEEVGGAGGNLLDSLLLCEEIIVAGGSSGVCAGLLTHGIALPHIIAAGDPRQIDRFVRPTLAGNMIGSLGISEPDAGSDVAGLRTTAVADGDSYIVNGTKLYITSGTRADFVTTAVRTGGQGYSGVSLLVIERDTPGFSVSRKLRKMGWWCSDTAELGYVDARVPARNLVGAEGAGFEQIMRNFDTERLSLATQAYATAQRCLDRTLSWVHDRQTFGRTLASRQVVRHRIAEMARQVDVARSYVRGIAARYVAGEDVSIEIAMAKNTAVQACDFVADEAVQFHGGMGYMRECEVERHYRDSRILGIGGGTNEIMNEIVSRRLGL